VKKGRLIYTDNQIIKWKDGLGVEGDASKGGELKPLQTHQKMA